MNEWLFFIGLLMAFLGFPTALIDHWSNRPYDYWTLKGLVMGGIGVGFCWLALP